jgi:hypothetical protein
MAVNLASKPELEQIILGSLTVQIRLSVVKVSPSSFALHLCVNQIKDSKQIT